MKNHFLKGAAILSVSMFLTKCLGILYSIPFQKLVGPSGVALYQYAYIPYTLFISLSTLGIPVGIAKFVSKYNSLGEYDTSRKVFRHSIIFMISLGVIGFLTLYTLAPFQAQNILAGNKKLSNSVEDVTMVIQTISFALLIIPVMAIFRGFFQGNQNMIPTSVSQLLEQIVRIVFILMGSYFIIHIKGGSIEEAVSFSVFSAFLAGVIAFGVLYYYWLKNLNTYNDLYKKSISHSPRKKIELYGELISYAIPFAILGLMSSLIQMVDQSTYNFYMIQGGFSENLVESSYGIYSGNLYKIIMIPVSFAIAFGQPLIPELTHCLTMGRLTQVKKNILLAIQLTCFITIPAIIGISLLAQPIYICFFDSAIFNQMGGEIFKTGSILGLFMALYSIITAILQGIGCQWYGICFLVLSLIIKYLGNILLIPIYYSDGATIASAIAYSFSIIGSLYMIKIKTNLKLRLVLKRITPIIIFSIIMAGVIVLVKPFLNSIIPYSENRLNSIMYVAISGAIGILIYFGLAVYFDLFSNLFGFKISFKELRQRINK